MAEWQVFWMKFLDEDRPRRVKPLSFTAKHTIMTSEHQRGAALDQLNLILSFFPRVDAKLSVLVAVNTGMLAVLATNAPPLAKLSWPTITIAALAILLIGTSLWFLYQGAFPRLKGGAASLVYFREIALRTEHKFIEEFKVQTDEYRVDDLLGQVWRNSEILKKKFDALKLAFILLAVALAPWLCSLVLFAGYNVATGVALFK
jgi:hypothetical protein